MLLPLSIRHRHKRLAKAKKMREKKRLCIQYLLVEVEAKEKMDRQRWGDILSPYAEKLAALMIDGNWTSADSDRRETEAVDIGVSSWQMGGLNCMQQLHSMAMDICERKYQGVKILNHTPGSYIDAYERSYT